MSEAMGRLREKLGKMEEKAENSKTEKAIAAAEAAVGELRGVLKGLGMWMGAFYDEGECEYYLRRNVSELIRMGHDLSAKMTPGAYEHLSENTEDVIVTKTEGEMMVEMSQKLAGMWEALLEARTRGNNGESEWNALVGQLSVGDSRASWAKQVCGHPDIVFFYAMCGKMRNFQQSEVMRPSFVEKVLMNTHGKVSTALE